MGGVKVVYLARHGETDWNRMRRWQGATDVPLNDEGRAQARALAARLGDLGLSRVWSSDLSRASETAAIVSAELALPRAGTLAHFRERSFGVFEGLTREECEARYPDAWRAYVEDHRTTPPEAEPAEAVVARMRAGIFRVARESGEGATLVVSHGACIRMTLAALGGAPRPPIANAAVFRLVVSAGDSVEIEEVE